MATRDLVDVYIGSKKCESVERKELFGYIVGLCMPHIQFMSKDAIIEWIEESCFLLEETLEWAKNPSLKRKITYVRDYIFRKRDILSRERTIMFLTNIVLSSQGLGTIPGLTIKKRN